MRPRPILVCAAAMTLALATVSAAQSPSPAPASSPSAALDTMTSLTSDQLLTLLRDRQPGDAPVTVIADATVLRDIGHGDSDCEPAVSTSPCRFGVLEGSVGDQPGVTADPVVAELYQRSGPSVEGLLGFTIDDDGISFLGSLVPAPDGTTWPVTADAMATAVDGVDAGRLVAVEGWLTVLGWGVPCPAPRPGIRGDPADSPFVRCPAGWILPDPDLPDQGPGMTSLQPSGFGIPVQYGAYQRFAPEPAEPVDSMAPPRLGIYLLRHIARDGGQPTAWQVAGRLDPIASSMPVSAQDPLTADAAGLSMAATLDRTVVEPGDSVVVSVTIHNGRDMPVVLGDGCPATMYASVPVPQGRPGRTWDGHAGDFKRFVLTAGEAPGGVPALEPTRIDARAHDCDVDTDALTLDPGTSVTTSLTWRAAITDGVPAAPGEIPFEVSVLHDPSGAPPSRAPDEQGPIASWIRSYEELKVDGTLSVAGSAPGTVTAGEAIDALLADQDFAAWLAKRPSRTWSQANLFLETKDVAEGIVPAGTSWDIELFREHGVPRDWAIGFVDASTGALRSVSFCDAPCDR